MTETLTGSRIRERRITAGIKQVALARTIGISASYLNLIEHNRRRIGGKVLLAIARALEVEPQALTQGAEAALLASLREAADEAQLARNEAARADEFAGRFPGWAHVLARSRNQIATLERTVEELTDRLDHDPQLAASIHELLSTAAAIRSTAAILADDQTLEAEWRTRFHTNIDADSRRLSDSAQAIVGMLEVVNAGSRETLSPQEEVEAFLSGHGFHFPALEAAEATVDAVIAQESALISEASRFIARGVLDQIRLDAQALPLAQLETALSDGVVNPATLARDLNVAMPVLLRRLAAVRDLGAGLVVCDRSGTVIFRKSVSGFSVPRYGACCPLWPLFSALGQPGLVAHDVITQRSDGPPAFDAYAAADVHGVPRYNRVPMLQSVMLLVPTNRSDAGARAVGASCRTCAHHACAARREPSVLQGVGAV